MKITKIVEPLKQSWVRQNVLLHEVLSNLDEWEKVLKIVDLTLLFASKGQMEDATDVLGLLWPAILWKCSSTTGLIDGIGPTSGEYQLKLTEMSEIENVALDNALQMYAEQLQRIIQYLISEKNLPTEVVELAGYELLSTAHLMTNPILVNKCFLFFVDSFVGYHPTVEKGGLLEKSPEILRRSLKDIPDRGGHQPAKNLLIYLQGVKSRLKTRDLAKQCVALWKMVEVISISLCHLIQPQEILELFLDAIKKTEKQEKVEQPSRP